MRVLPSDELIVIWVFGCSDETTSPIGVNTKGLQILLSKGREEVKPMVGVRESRDVCLRDLELQKDLILSQRGPHGILRSLLALGSSRLITSGVSRVDFSSETDGCGGNRHASAMESKWEEGTLSLLSLVTSHELSLCH